MAQKVMSNKLMLKDLRVMKTNKALCEALFKMLRSRNFNGITVNELCIEALVSRAAFYSHFHDKYDLLNYILVEIQKDIMQDVSKYDALEFKVNQLISSNKKVIANIIKDANKETLALLRVFIESTVELLVKRTTKNKDSTQYIILSNFFVGGLLNLLTWLVENNFPPNVSMINSYTYRMFEIIRVWDTEPDANIVSE